MKRKKSIVMILVLCMTAALLAGCGSKKEKKPEIVKGTIPEMVKAMQEVKEGKLQVEMTYSATSSYLDDITDPYADEKKITKNLGMELVYDRPNREYSLSVSYSDNDSNSKDQAFDKELVRVTGNSVYFNLGAVSEGSKVGKISEERLNVADFSGWFEFPLPDDLPKDLPISGFEGSFFTMVEKAVKGLPTEGVDGDYTVSLKTREDYAQLLSSLRDYVDNDLSKTGDNVESLGDTLLKIDWNKYVEKLLDTYESDIREAIKAFGKEISINETKIDSFVKEVKSQDFNKIVKEYVEKASKKAEGMTYQRAMAKFVEELSRELESYKEDVDKEPSAISIRVKADDSAYVITIKSDKVAESNDTTEIVFRLKPGSQSVEAPGDTKSIKQIADMLSKSYLAYVNKSRMSTDISTLDEYLLAAEKVAADPQFDLPAKTVFSVYIVDGETTLSILPPTGAADAYDDALTEWKDICNYYEYREFKSAAMKNATVRFLGTVDASGSVSWKTEEINDSFREMIEYSPDFARKWVLN